MKRRSPALFPAVMAGVVALVLLSGFLLPNLRRPAPENLSLPPSPSLYNPVSGGSIAPAVTEVPAEIISVNPETVQAVLKTIYRPENYTAVYSTTWHYDSTQLSTYTNIYARGGAVKIETLDSYGQIDTYYLTDGKILCFWEDKSLILTTVSMGERGTDNPARIPTYESIFDSDKSDILSAAYEIHDGRPYVVLLTGGPVYDTTWWISLDTGLMHRAELTEKDGSPAISVEMLIYDLKYPDEDLFILPDRRSFEELLAEYDGF